MYCFECRNLDIGTLSLDVKFCAGKESREAYGSTIESSHDATIFMPSCVTR